MTQAVVASMIISDLIAGRRNEWSHLFDAKRAALLDSPVESLKNGLEVARHLVGGKLAALFASSEVEVESGEARIIEVDGKRLAAYRDPAGELHRVAAECTHMGCELSWNTAELSWDCPCHGSRFDYDGSVIQGPATKDLEAVP